MERLCFKKLQDVTGSRVHNGSEVRPEEGLDIETTIDINLQDVANAAPVVSITKSKGRLWQRSSHGGWNRGKSRQFSNLTRYEKAGYVDYREIYNYAVQDATEPGFYF